MEYVLSKNKHMDTDIEADRLGGAKKTVDEDAYDFFQARPLLLLPAKALCVPETWILGMRLSKRKYSQMVPRCSTALHCTMHMT